MVSQARGDCSGLVDTLLRFYKHTAIVIVDNNSGMFITIISTPQRNLWIASKANYYHTLLTCSLGMPSFGSGQPPVDNVVN